MSFTPSTSPQAVAPDPTLAAQSNDPIVLMFNALYSLLQVFNLESLIRIPGQSNPNDASTPGWSLLKILVIGLVAEFARRNAQDILVYLTERFFITVSFQERDPCYEWVLVWLSKQPNWKTIRTATISTVVNGNLCNVGAGDSSNPNSPQTIYSIPEVYKTYWVRTNGYWVSVTRSRQEATGMYTESKMEYVLHLRIMTIKDAKVLYDFIEQVRKVYMESQRMRIRIFAADEGCYWRCTGSCTKRPLSSVVLAKSVKDMVLSDVGEFLDSRNWYIDRGIPYRRGYLFYGKPGTGKTSFISALAGEFGLDIYNLSLATGMDNNKLADLVSQIPERALLLMEDIDAAYINGINREQQKKQSNNNERSIEIKGGLTLSGLLNVVDGVGAGEGRIMVATTNYYDRLDEALIRPGRIDLEVKFDLANKYQAKEQFCQFYVPHSITKEKEPGLTLSNKKKSQSLTDKGEKGSPADILAENYFEDKDLNLDDFDLNARISRLADQFVEDFPEYVISSASLQQYLLMYKSGPIEAVANFKTWVQGEIERKERKMTESQPDSESEKVTEALETVTGHTSGNYRNSGRGYRGRGYHR